MPHRFELEKELKELHQDLEHMGSLVMAQLSRTYQAIEKLDLELAQQIIDLDDEIDDLERRIEKECILTIARQQPMASDLRDITSVLKLITDLERIADHCEDISKYLLKLGDAPKIRPISNILEMSLVTKVMVEKVVESAISKNETIVSETYKMDDRVDELFEDSITQLMGMIENTPELARDATYLMMIVKYYERIGDHATNVADWIEYNITGHHFEE